MRYLYKCSLFILFISLLGCEPLMGRVKETPDGYEIKKDTNMVVILQTPLSSNVNQRGDQFTTKLKQPLVFRDKTILAKDTQIRGLVKRVTKYQRFGDRASLVLLFDQIVLPTGRKIPKFSGSESDVGSQGRYCETQYVL